MLSEYLFIKVVVCLRCKGIMWGKLIILFCLFVVDCEDLVVVAWYWDLLRGSVLARIFNRILVEMMVSTSVLVTRQMGIARVNKKRGSDAFRLIIKLIRQIILKLLLATGELTER